MKGKRWGKKYKDNRNWKEENSKLVKRGEFYINPIFLDNWLGELKEMNYIKIGQPYLYPHSMIQFLALLYAKSFSYRELEGFMRGLSRRLCPFPVISYSQIRKRIRKLPLSFKAKRNNLIVGIDATGNKVSNRGEWIREKWKVRRGWIKVVLMGDTKGNIVDIRIGNEDLDERASGRGMLRKDKKHIEKALMDGWHDCENTFNLCKELEIEPAIKIRENASEHGLGARAEEVRLYKNIGYKKWAEEKGYGYRWVATESIISATKRMFGECVRSHKKRNMYHEARLKFWAYQKIKDLA